GQTHSFCCSYGCFTGGPYGVQTEEVIECRHETTFDGYSQLKLWALFGTLRLTYNGTTFIPYLGWHLAVYVFGAPYNLNFGWGWIRRVYSLFSYSYPALSFDIATAGLGQLTYPGITDSFFGQITTTDGVTVKW